MVFLLFDCILLPSVLIIWWPISLSLFTNGKHIMMVSAKRQILGSLRVFWILLISCSLSLFAILWINVILLNYCLFDWLIDWLIDWMIGWLVDWMHVWPNEWLKHIYIISTIPCRVCYFIIISFDFQHLIAGFRNPIGFVVSKMKASSQSDVSQATYRRYMHKQVHLS